MLQLLKESVSTRHSERLEQIVIALIAIEIGQFSFCPLWTSLDTDSDLLDSPGHHYYPHRSVVGLSLRISFVPCITLAWFVFSREQDYIPHIQLD